MLKNRYALAALAGGILAFALSASASVLINEFDYDQPGSPDTAEFVELAGTVGANLSGWTLEFVNGANDMVYHSIALPSFSFTDQTGTGWGFYVLGRAGTVANTNLDFATIDTPGPGLTPGDNYIQNGAPDGIRLLDPAANVVQYLSYEGTVDSGVNDLVGPSQNNIVAGSIYKTGIGSSFSDFTWTMQENVTTPGALNPGQTLTPEPATISLITIAGACMLARRRR